MARPLPSTVYKVENAVRVATALSAYMNGDVEPIINLCSDDVVWHSIADPHHMPFGGVFHGRAGVRDYFRLLFAAYLFDDVTVLDVIPAGDEVLHVIRVKARRSDGAARGETLIVGRWRFQDGAVVSYTDYFDVMAAVHTSASDRVFARHARVTSDPSYAVYRNDQAIMVSEMLASYCRGDPSRLFDILAPDVVWRSVAERGDAAFGGVYRGKDAVREYFDRLTRSVVLLEYNVIDVIPAREETIHIADVLAHVAGLPEAIVRVRLVCFSTFRDGYVAAFTEYLDVVNFLFQRDGL